MLYNFPGSREEDTYLNESDIRRIARQTFNQILQERIPEPPSNIFEWNEEQDMIDMTGLTDIHLIS